MRRERPTHSRAAEQRDEIAPVHRAILSRASHREDSTSQPRQETAALQDFNRANVGSGSTD